MNSPTAPTSSKDTPLTFQLPNQLIEAIAQRAATLVIERMRQQVGQVSPYMTIPEAATYARCKRQRIDDLLSMRRLTRFKDGRRTLILRAELDAYLTRNQPRTGGRN